MRKAQLGHPTATEAEALLDRDPDPDAWISRLQVRAATPDPVEKQAVWQTVVIDRAVPLAFVKTVTPPFWSAGQDDVLKPYADAYLNLVPSLHRGGSMPADTYTRTLFPLFGIDLAYLQQVESLTMPNPTVRRNVLERADLVRRMLRSRG